MRQKRRVERGVEYTGSIVEIRSIEDSIRATKKYTEGIGTMRKKHPIQGEEFPSKVFCKYYEVYPTTELSWDMPVGVALDWLWHDVPCVDVMFKYDYRVNKASVAVTAGLGAIRELRNAIPNFREALARVAASSNGKSASGEITNGETGDSRAGESPA